MEISGMDDLNKSSRFFFVSSGAYWDVNLRIHRFPEKALVLLDECLQKGTRPASISSRPSSDQFILKESQSRFLTSDCRSIELMPFFSLV